MTNLFLIMGDQLNSNNLKNVDKSKDVILMCEVHGEATYVKHHKKKIAFLFSAMRHFANDIVNKGYNIEYVKLNDKENKGSFTKQVEYTIKKLNINKLIITSPSEYRVLEKTKTWQKQFGIEVIVKNNNQFLCTKEEFKQWASTHKSLRMEYFYRYMRKKHNILMEKNDPIGGQWNYDKENRKPPTGKLSIPQPYKRNLDNIDTEVMSLVEKEFTYHFGDINPFHFAVTRKEALIALDDFIKNRLPLFGTYQDAMIENEPWMYHSHISFYINCGLLTPIECIQKAESAYYNKEAPLNAVEGFIRQILGWREYVNGIYWLNMPEYAEKNHLNAQHKLPSFYWTADTKMNCLHQCIKETKENAYAHHIQRLMVLGNFALLIGIHPKEINEWYLIVYADAFEWVELPNVTGMALYADGGHLASKPYAAGGNYINKMSNYCNNCSYKVTKRTGEDACPFNYLYWNFLIKNKDKLQHNPRVRMIYNTLNKMDSTEIEAIETNSKKFLEGIK